jgi:hypothetical protein
MKTLKLSQRGPVFKRLEVAVDSDVSVRESSLFRSTEVTFPLDRVARSPVHIRYVAVRWVLAAIFFLCLLVASLYAKGMGEGPGELFGSLLLAGVCAACALNAWKLSGNVLVFKDRNSSSNLFSIARARPSRDAVDEFLKGIAERIEGVRAPSDLSGPELRAWQTNALGYLLEHNVLLPEEFSTISERLQRKEMQRGAVISLVPR